MRPMIPWMGGKSRLANRILPLFGEHHAYVEPFCGGAALFFKKEPSPVEVLNDRNGEVVNLFRVVQHHLEEFLRHFKWALTSRQDFLREQQVPPDTLTDIQRAARFYYLQRLAFGARPTGQSFGTSTTSPPKLNLLRMEEELSQAHLRLARVTIESLDWKECVRRYDRPHTLFYLDPPYWGTEGYGENFPWEEYEQLAKIAAESEGEVLVSVNDHPDIRALFKGFSIRELSTTYTVGKGSGKKAAELVIQNG